MLYEVGGCVRDDLLGIPSKDIDYCAEAPSFDALREWLVEGGFEIFVDMPEYLTLRARFPRDGGWEHSGKTADFVMARIDGEYTDGRRPDVVTPGTILDDLARRDFTVNAMARTASGVLLDPHNGQRDLATRTLRAVGNPMLRLAEDPLRALRAVRFAVTKGFTIESNLGFALSTVTMADLVSTVVVERRREELHKAFLFDTVKTLALLSELGRPMLHAALADMWLKPTTEDR